MSDEIEPFWKILISPKTDEGDLWTMTTLGMGESISGQEFIIRDIPSLFLGGAGDLLNNLCLFVVRHNRVILDGETFSGDPFTMIRFETTMFGETEMLELHPVEDYYRNGLGSRCDGECRT